MLIEKVKHVHFNVVCISNISTASVNNDYDTSITLVYASTNQ